MFRRGRALRGRLQVRHSTAAGQGGRLSAAKAAAPVHGAHVGEGDGGGVHQGGGVRRLALLRGGNHAAQLTLNALRPEAAEGLEGLHAGLELLIGIKPGWVLLHIGGNQCCCGLDHFRDVHGLQELPEILVIQLRVLRAAENPVYHRAAVPAVNGGVDGGVDLAARVAALEGAVGQVVVPGNHGEAALFFVEVVVVNHGAGVAVAVSDEVVNHEVAEDLVHVQDILQAFALAQGLQRGDEPGLVRLCDVGFGVFEDVGIAVRVVVYVPEFDIAAVHASKIAGGFPSDFSAEGFAPFSGTVTPGAERLAVRRGGERAVREGPTLGGGAVSVGVQEFVHVKLPTVAPASAEAHAVRFVELAGIAAVVPPEEAVLHALHRQVQAPVLAVDGDIDIAAQGCVRTEGPHHLIGEIVFHVGGVLYGVVQAQLVQAVVGPGAVVVVELQLEAVAVAVHGGDHG